MISKQNNRVKADSPDGKGQYKGQQRAIHADRPDLLGISASPPIVNAASSGVNGRGMRLRMGRSCRAEPRRVSVRDPFALEDEPGSERASFSLAKDHDDKVDIVRRGETDMPAENPSESMKRLATLIRARDAEGIAALGRDDPNLRRELDDALPGGPFGATPLLVATHRGDIAVIDALLEIGANIDGRSHWWAGSFGVLDGSPKIAAQMIERGATVDINAAAHLGMIDRARQLLDADPSLVNHRGGDGQTPLHVAATVEMADLLLDRGADVNAHDIDHESTPAQYATKDRIDVARRLVKHRCRGRHSAGLRHRRPGSVKKLVEADPRCVMTTVSEDWFPKKDPKSGGIIYIWTLGQHKTPQEVAGHEGHADIVRFFRKTARELNLLGACMTGDQVLVDKILAENPNLKSSTLDAASRSHRRGRDE